MQKRSTRVLVYATVGSGSTKPQRPQPQPQATASSDWMPAAQTSKGVGVSSGGGGTRSRQCLTSLQDPRVVYHGCLFLLVMQGQPAA